MPRERAQENRSTGGKDSVLPSTVARPDPQRVDIVPVAGACHERALRASGDERVLEDPLDGPGGRPSADDLATRQTELPPGLRRDRV